VSGPIAPTFAKKARSSCESTDQSSGSVPAGGATGSATPAACAAAGSRSEGVAAGACVCGARSPSTRVRGSCCRGRSEASDPPMPFTFMRIYRLQISRARRSIAFADWKTVAFAS
jgi:hypothetical protein